MSTLSIPHEIIVDILSRLPVKSLLRFRCVCKPWCTLITDPNFIKMHLKRATENNNLSLMLRDCYLYSIDYDASFDEAVEIDYPFKSPNNGAEILGSCNGLLCITTGYDAICLWNPSTKEYKKLPTTTIEFLGGLAICTIVYGFGYDPMLEDYKVVRVVYFYDNDDDSYDSEVKIYTLGTNSWRRIQDIPYYIYHRRVSGVLLHVSGVLVNGALHWVATRSPELQISKLIISFDIGKEEYREVPQPNYFDDKFHMNVGVLGGCLCIISNFYKIRVEVWVMKDYGVRESWTKLFTISQPIVIRSFEYLKPLRFSKNGEIILEKDNKDLILYDPKCEKTRNLRIRGVPNWFETEAYLGSLISLKSGTYVGQGKRRQKKKNRKKRDDVGLVMNIE